MITVDRQALAILQDAAMNYIRTLDAKADFGEIANIKQALAMTIVKDEE